MATIASALDIAFTPAAGSFNIQVSEGHIVLQRSNSVLAPWVAIPESPFAPGAWVICNPVAGARYRAVTACYAPVFQADQ